MLVSRSFCNSENWRGRPQSPYIIGLRMFVVIRCSHRLTEYSGAADHIVWYGYCYTAIQVSFISLLAKCSSMIVSANSGMALIRFKLIVGKLPCSVRYRDKIDALCLYYILFIRICSNISSVFSVGWAYSFDALFHNLQFFIFNGCG